MINGEVDEALTLFEVFEDAEFDDEDVVTPADNGLDEGDQQPLDAFTS